jgi:hypothetical protein
MKTITVRLPDALAARLAAESRARGLSKSEVVRERLEARSRVDEQQTSPFHDIADLVGTVDGLPTDLSARKKYYLKSTGYGRKRSR